MLTIANLKAHAESFIATRLSQVEGEISSTAHALVRRFAEFVEGQEAEADAIKLLTDHGYTVSPPPTAITT